LLLGDKWNVLDALHMNGLNSSAAAAYLNRDDVKQALHASVKNFTSFNPMV
jgi:hypothetical protein